MAAKKTIEQKLADRRRKLERQQASIDVMAARMKIKELLGNVAVQAGVGTLDVENEVNRDEEVEAPDWFTVLAGYVKAIREANKVMAADAPQTQS